MLEIRILQAARLKGRLSLESATASAAVSESEAAGEIDRLRNLGLLKGDASVRTTPEGKAHLGKLVDAERETIDTDALATAYEEFDAFNTRLKVIVNDWQLRDGVPNDHSDKTYDDAVIDRLAELHEGFRSLVDRIVEIAPRLAPYPGRFAHAIERVRAGDHTFIARPIADSYHTVWFELHEELVGLLNLNRAEEAAAGRAV